MTEVKAKLWLEKDGKIILGKGRAQLLSQIEKSGSLSEAAKTMNMSYSHAWSEIKEISEALGESVIDTARGGKEGGSSKLTSVGKEILKKFEKEIESLDRHLASRNH
jgi:molybdate transport system regulatory protein